MAKNHSPVLYRKYRPTKLSDVIGQPQITDTLAKAIAEGKIAHAYLFIGPRGTGKTSVARILAHAINHFDYEVEDDYLDIIEIDAASNTGVDNIRELREKAVIAPTKGRFKVYIIDEIHMLTKSASNALLKILEEPPEHVVFIMATTDAHKVPITISSRAQVHTFRLADPETMFQHLRHIADQENIPITNDALRIVVKRGGGSFRDSLSLLDQITSLTDKEITAELLNSALGLPAEELVQNLLHAYAQHDSATLTRLLQDLFNSSAQPTTLAGELISAIIAQPRPELLPLLERLPQVEPPFPEAKLLLAFLKDSKEGNPGQNHAAKTPDAAKTPEAPETSEIPEAPEAPKTLETPKAPSAPPARSAFPRPDRPNTPARLKTPAKPVAAQPSPEDSAPQSLTFDQRKSRPFTWEDFLETVKSENSAIHSQLTKVEHKLDGNRLHLYPRLKIARSILDRPNNRTLIEQALPSHITFEIHDIDEYTPPKDDTLSQISAIMGDVQEVSSDSPF